MLYLLDTDVCVDVIRRREPASARLRQTSPEDLAVSAMTVAELRFGALNGSDAERALASVAAFLSAPLAVLPFGLEAADRHAEVRYALRHRPIGERDLVIAATALAADLRLVTWNHRHMGRVPGLVLEDWARVV